MAIVFCKRNGACCFKGTAAAPMVTGNPIHHVYLQSDFAGPMPPEAAATHGHAPSHPPFAPGGFTQYPPPPPGFAQQPPPPGFAQSVPPPGFAQTMPPPGFAQSMPPPPGFAQTMPPPGFSQYPPPKVV